jgi:cytochrome c-type biogenesis protein CcmE
MIPENKKRSATILTVICFAVVALGITLGAIWVSIYMPK